MADADLLIEEVTAYLKPQDVEHIREAIEFSRIAHHGQMRKSGEPYVTHPIAVARILTTLHIDEYRFIRSGNVWESDNFATSPSKLDLRIDTVLGTINVR